MHLARGNTPSPQLLSPHAGRGSCAESRRLCVPLFTCEPTCRDRSAHPLLCAGTRSKGLRSFLMDRFFLAVIVSGVLLAATSMSLLVVTGGGTTVAALNPAPATTAQSIRPLLPDHTIFVRNDSAR